LTFNELHGIISQKTEFFIPITVRTSKPTFIYLFTRILPVENSTRALICCIEGNTKEVSQKYMLAQDGDDLLALVQLYYSNLICMDY
jgi:hypothetical protein